MSDLFRDILPSILYTKKPIDDEKSYVPFIVNRALSYHIDCVLAANEMNIRPNIDKKLGYDFLLHIIRPRKRPFEKWVKPEKDSDLEAIKEFYGISNAKAKEALRILKPDQVKEIKAAVDKGGAII